MANNNFKPFAAAANANVMTQADYEALAALVTGFVSGTAQSAQLNKVWRQSSIIAAVLAQFIVDLTGQDAVDDGTTATLLANLKIAVQAQSAAVIGHARNLVMSVPLASTAATLTADEVVVGTALGGQKYLLKQFSKSINLTATGAGGMDTGSAPLSGYVALYAIYNPTTGTTGLLARNATSAIAPNVYGGANMPAGFTASALVSVWPTNSSGQLKSGYQNDRRVSFTYTNILTTNVTQPSLTSLSVASVIPANALSVSGSCAMSSTSASTLQMDLAGDANTTGQNRTGFTTAGGSQGGVASFNIPIIYPQTIYYAATSTAGTPNFSSSISSYVF
ncbi:hypothetical protein [Burkholderia anthinoferrum]|uniref:hypothetical protein n=1 Tax=Burkholderia anthinoferrum TaxID=3090833 RepID=UPI000CE16A02|nr:hypothetical protein [Burkholderia anthinoferrum]